MLPLSMKRELTVLTSPTVIKFATLAEDHELQALTQSERSAALQSFLQGKDVVDLLRAYPGVVRDAQLLVNLLAPLKPRLYSIASSLAAFPDQVHLTISTVRYESDGRRRGGLRACSAP